MLPVPVCHGGFAVNGIVALGIICPPVRTPAFFSGEGTFQHGTAQKRKGARQFADFLNACFQCLCIPHDTECVQQDTIHLHLSVRGKFGQKGFFGTGHIGGTDCFPAGSFRSNLSSIDRTQKRISTQTVCAMVLSAAFTGSVQIPHRSAVPLVHLNASHKVVDTRQNRNGFFANIFVQIGLTIIHQSSPLVFNYLFCINPALEPFSDADFRNDLKAFVSGETEVLSDAGLPHMTLSVCETDYPLLCYATALCERLTAAGADVTLKQYSETMLRSRAINGRYQLLLVSENTLDATALPDADILLLSAEEMEDPSCEN